MVEQHFRKVKVPGSNPGGGSTDHPQDIRPAYTLVLAALSVLLHAALWALRSSYIAFNPLPIVFGLAILIANGLLQRFVLGPGSVASLILGTATAYIQLLLLVLLLASRA